MMVWLKKKSTPLFFALAFRLGDKAPQLRLIERPAQLRSTINPFHHGNARAVSFQQVIIFGDVDLFGRYAH